MKSSISAFLAACILGSCSLIPSGTAPRNLDNACSIVEQRPKYLQAFKETERRWGVPVNVQMAVIHQESRFRANAKTPMSYILGIIPRGRQSSAYGYAQALDGTWQEYKKSTGRVLARRSNIHDATDFMGWYMNNTKRRKLPIQDAYKIIVDEEAARLISDDDIKSTAIANVESRGIVFLDEIDKVCRRENAQGADVSREGVQRDLLPLIEGTTVQTKFGSVKTDHILFIASGAFHLSKPSDMLPELQGRLPIRVELDALNSEDFKRILKEPDNSLIKQYKALLKTEDVELDFSDN